jgi:hypothetical protein
MPEIKLKRKYQDVTNGHQKSGGSGNSGANKHRGEVDKTRLAAAQEQTRQGQKVLILAGGRRRTWARARDMVQ